MYTPHPSLVPIEMAAGGLVTVTNTFREQDREGDGRDLGEPDRGAPTVDGVVAGLRAAIAAADDYAKRVAASEVNWSRDWSTSFDERLLGEILAALDG